MPQSNNVDRLSALKASLHESIESIQKIASANLLDEGLTCESCQLVCIVNLSIELDHLVTGISVNDLKAN